MTGAPSTRPYAGTWRRTTSCSPSSTTRRCLSAVPSSCWPRCTISSWPGPTIRWPRTTTRWPACAALPFHPPRSDVAADFADFCRLHRSDIERLVADRTTQTNEVGRCTSLLPALCHVAAAYPAATPFSLLDLGTSAGLNLLFDDYAYTYRQEKGDHVVRAGAAGGDVTLECRVRGELTDLPALEAPAIAARVGLDLTPIDPRAEDEARWLLACQWPENPARFGRLRSALANVTASPHPPRLERGDMIDDLDRIVASMEATGPLVVFHSWVAAYLDEPRQEALASAVHALDRPARPVHHLYAESPLETPGLPTPTAPIRRDGPDLATALVHLGPGGAAPIRLADTHPHGYWIRWWPHDSGFAAGPVGSVS